MLNRTMKRWISSTLILILIYTSQGVVSADSGVESYASKDLSADHRVAKSKPNPKPEKPSVDKKEPSKPSNLTSSAKTSTTVSLTWNASNDNVGVTGYDIYSGGKGKGATIVGSTTSTSYEVTGLNADTEYDFNVIAKDAAGNHSKASKVISVTTENETPMWSLVWNDEFTAEEIDTDKWMFDIGNGEGGWGNQELEYYTDREENVDIVDGALVITARNESYEGFDYTSAKIKTKGKYSKKYGKFEIKAKLPTGKGYWPAIWMLPENDEYGTWASSGEIDIMESWGSKPHTIAGTIHYGQNWPNNTYTGNDYDLGESTIEDYHVFSLEWEPGEMRWYIDGILYSTQNDWYSKSLYQPADNTYPAPFDKEFHLIMNLAVGGHFDGNPDETTIFPKTMSVDYVRIYELTGRPYREPTIPVLPKDDLPDDARMPLADGNLVYNNNFDQDLAEIPNLGSVDGVGGVANTDYWSLFTGEGGTGNVTIDALDGSNYAKMNITAPGIQPYSVQLLNEVSIAKGRYYKLSFDAKSSENRGIGFKLTGGAARGFVAYSPAHTINITNEFQSYEMYFQMKQDTDIAARTEFNVGLNNKPVWIGNVRLEEVGHIPFDYDLPKTPLSGSGNHVYNGTFDQGEMSRMSYWHLDTDDAAVATGSVSEAERKLNVNITNAGNGEKAAVKLTQKGINLIKNQTYKITLDANAATARDIEVEWVSKDGSVSYGKETLSLVTADTEVSASFTMLEDTDTEAQLIFHLGGSTGTIQLDNIVMIRTSVYYDPDLVYYPLVNGDFAQGMNPWTIVSDSGGFVTGIIDGEEVKLTVGNQGLNPWSAMLIQSDLSLANGITYDLSFDARSTMNRKLETIVENATFTRFIDQTVDLTNDVSHHEFEFTMPKNDTASLKFLLGKIVGTTAVGEHDVFIDNVVLEVKDAPVSRPPTLLTDSTGNHVGQPVEITFMDNALWRQSVTAVKLNDVVLTADQYALTAGILTLNSGNFGIAASYTISIDADGYARAFVNQLILADDGNLIINGNFSNELDSWTHWAGEGGVSTLTNVDGAAEIAITNIGGASWHTQVFQTGIPLLAGKTYELSFRAWSTLDRPITIEYTDTPIPVSSFNLTDNEATIHTNTFTAVVDDVLKLNFLLGNVTNGAVTTPSAAHTIFLDDLVLKEVTDGPEEGHALLNGTFDTNVDGWGTYKADGSNAVESVEDGKLKVDFTAYDGWFPWSTQVFQDHLKLEAGLTYELKFEASSTLNKSVLLEITGTGPAHLTQTAVALTATTQSFTYEFTVGAMDQNAKLNFLLGSNNVPGESFVAHSINLDNITLLEKEEDPELPNLIINGDYSDGMASWTHWFGDGGASTSSIESGAAAIEVTNNGGIHPEWGIPIGWSTQLYQTGISLLAGKTYELKFRAWSTLDRPITVEYTGTAIPAVSFDLSDDSASMYTAQFTVAANSTLKLNYLLGNVTNGAMTTPSEAHTIFLDDVTLREKTDDPTEPSGDDVIFLGAGSYSTVLPAGEADVVQTKIMKTENVTGKMQTNDWWSNLAWDTYSEMQYPHPLAMKNQASGMRIYYPGNRITGNANFIKGWMNDIHDVVVGHSNVASFPDAKVDSFSDWFVTAQYKTGSNAMDITYGHGSPYVYFNYEGGNPKLSFYTAPIIWSGDAGSSVLGVTIEGAHYGLFGPTASTWSGIGTTELTNHLPEGKAYFSIAALPDNQLTTLNKFKQYAYSHVTGTTVDWSYDSVNSEVNTTYTYETSAKEGTQDGTIFAMYPHQWKNSDVSLLSYSYNSVRGVMKTAEGSSFQTSMKFTGVLPSLPDHGTYDMTTLGQYVDDAEAEVYDFNTIDTYWVGKRLGKLATLAPIADQVGDTAAANKFRNEIKTILQAWFKATDESGFIKNNTMFYYDNNWGTLIGYPDSYGSAVELNDHHFHYGYFIKAAAEIARVDKTWMNDQNWGPMVNLLISDMANSDRDNEMFPFLRNFDPYAGHSWASGHARFGDGNNNESSSEALNAWAGMILWGEATGDDAIRDLGIYQYTTEMNAVNEYWFDVHNENHHEGFTRSTASMIWGGKTVGDGVWWTANPEEVHGINWLPITGASVYLTQYPAYTAYNYATMVTENGGTSFDLWEDLIYMYRAISDVTEAKASFASRASAMTPEAGNSKANAYHWIHNLDGMGNVDITVTADYPIYAVFKKNNVKTYVVYNMTSTELTVNFSDGHTIIVQPNSFGGGAPLDVVAPTTPSNLASPSKTSTSIQLTWTASTDDREVTEYEIYKEGTTLAGTSSTNSFQVTGLIPETEYSFTVVAKDDAGNTSDSSSELSVTTNGTTGDVTPPTAPTNLISPAKTSTTVSLSWTASTDEVDVTGYDVYAGADLIATVTSTTYMAADLMPSTLYTFTIKAKDAAGNQSAASSGLDVTTTASDPVVPIGQPVTLYLVENDSVKGLAVTAGSAEAESIITGGSASPITFTIDNVTATYGSGVTTYQSYYDTVGPIVGTGVIQRISYDFDGDGAWDRVETSPLYALNPVVNEWERFTQIDRGSVTVTGSNYQNFSNGVIRIEIWNELGAASTTKVKVNAPSNATQFLFPYIF